MSSSPASASRSAWRLPMSRLGIVAVALLLIVGGVVVSSRANLWSGLRIAADEPGPITDTVKRGRFLFQSVERGNIESASNIEIRCEVQAKNSTGTAILEIIPEGTYVHQGDVLCRLDSSALENDCTKQQISVSNSEAAWIKAQNDYATAQIAKREYEEGTFRQEEQTAQSEISTAQENLRRARDYVKYSERLAVRGYVTQLQLEADRFAVEKAQKDLEVAETKLTVLREFTKAKTLKELDSAIATAAATLKAAERTLKLDRDQLKLIEDQIEKCVIHAPTAGQVVYANESASRGGNRDIIIQAGEMVRERQVIIRLPDPQRMQVKARINEARVSLVRQGMPAVIRMDAFPDVELHGRVEKVNEYPAPTTFFNPNVKEYETVISIADTPKGIRPGLTAEVRIQIEDLADVNMVPVQAIFEHGANYYCIVRNGDVWEPRKITLGSTNDDVVVITDGLKEGEMFVHNAAAMRDRVTLPPAERGLAGGLSKLDAIAAAANHKAAKSDSHGEAAPGDAREASDGGARRKRSRAGDGPGNADPPGGSATDDRGPSPVRPVGQFAADASGTSSAAAADPQARAQKIFEQFDPDGDGRIELSSLPESMRTRFSPLDRNGDGVLDRGEIAAMARGARRSANGGPDARGPQAAEASGRPSGQQGAAP